MRTRDFLPPLTKTADDVFAPLSKEHKARQTLYAKYWQYYRGHHRKNIKVKAGQADDNVILNWSKKVVNTGIEFLFGKPVTFEIEAEDERTEAEQYLDRLWADDAATGFIQSVFLKKLAQNGAVTGTPVVRLHTRENGEPYLRAIDPAILDIVTDPNDVDMVTEYHLVWKSGDDWLRHRWIRENDLAWSYLEEQHNRGGKWTTDEQTPWEFDFAPIFHQQNLILANSQWGISDLEDADLNDVINFVASNTNRIVRFHAHPKTVGTGFSANMLEATSVDGFWTIPGADSRVFNLEMDSDLASSRAHKADLEEVYHQVAGIPRLDPASVNLGALSGFALQILYGSLLAKTNDKRGTYGGLLAQINRALLVLGGFEEQAVETIWQNPLPNNELEKAQLFQTIAAASGNIEAAAKIAGYNREEIELLVESATLPPLIP